MSNKSSVILGISGGVDSAVAAFLLKEQGYEVKAVFMQNWKSENNDPHCSASQDLADARAVCDQLNIPLTTVDFSAEYWQYVFQYMLDEYAAGRTPNPDVICNKEIKFKAFLQHAKNLHADYMATGHYARCTLFNGKYHLLKGSDVNKDQSYFLYTLTQEQLSYALFPICDLAKTEVRAIAKKIGLSNSAKKDSTGICFIGERKFKKFLSEYLLAKPGDIYTADGHHIGKHDGLMFYTLGQRQGLNIGGLKNAKEAPWYVVSKNTENNRLIVAQEHDHPLLLTHEIYCHEIHWITNDVPKYPFKCMAKIRYRQVDQDCIVSRHEDSNVNFAKYKIEFIAAQWAATPGQSIVFYQQDECLGGSIIV